METIKSPYTPLLLTQPKSAKLISMKKLTATLCLTIAVLLGSAGMSASTDFQKGLTAYKSGDYATALREWKLLAEQGLVPAQYGLGFMFRKGHGVPQNDKTAIHSLITLRHWRGSFH